MKWNQLLCGIGIGFLSGYMTKKVITEKSLVSPEAVLRQVKARIKDRGTISGSWILMKPEVFEKNSLKYTVYKGGITQNDKGVQKRCEFIVDARTGTILELATV